MTYGKLNVGRALGQSGRVTKYTYDLAGQVRNVTAAFGTADASTVSSTYDAAGRVPTRPDGRGNVTTSGYDDAGRLTKTTYADGSTTQSIGVLRINLRRFPEARLRFGKIPAPQLEQPQLVVRIGLMRVQCRRLQRPLERLTGRERCADSAEGRAH